MTEPTVTVRGDAVVPVRPDEGIWTIELEVLDEAPDAALAEAGRRGETLNGLLDELAIAAAQRTTAGVTVREEFDYVDGKQVRRGFRAANTVTVRVADPAVAGRLLQEATSRAQASVRGPEWWIAPDNPARLEACRRSVEAARRKAEAYAEALGLRLGPVVDVREPTVGGQPFPLPKGSTMAMRAMADTAVEVDPGELNVGATIEVTYRLDG